MRWPLFFILFAPLSWANNPNEMLSDKELSKKFVSLIKENEIDKLIKNTKDFKECRDKNTYKPDATPDQKEQQIKAAQECFVKKIENKPTKDIQKLSEQLGLESYQLVKSKNVKDITSYLGDRMYKALTGISENDKRTEAQLANLQFKDRQIVDQVEFFRLYSYQLTKNAMLEISRYCFQNFQNTTKTNEGKPSDLNFADHWKDYFNKNPNLSFSDSGNHQWANLSAADADPSASYQKIFSSFGNIDPKKLGDFWNFCTKSMKELCDKYNTDTGKSHGANSCLTINRLRNIRNAIADTETIQNQMNEEGRKGVAIGVAAKYFKAEGKNSYDNLTNIASSDLLNGKVDQKLSTLVTDCQDKPEHPDCDNFIAQGGTSNDELIHKIDQEMRFKQEAEIARLIQIKKDNEASFQEYLEKNGYFDLAQKKDISEDDIKKFLAREFDAKRVAVTDQLRKKVGSRQVADDAKKEDKAAKIVASAKETQEERARLAQVILFNNIITSNLDLFDSKMNPIGKNTGAWKKESESLAKSNINQSLFQNIQSAIDTSGSGTDNKSISGTEFLDLILGKTPTEKK
jgi:hypothetical protein